MFCRFSFHSGETQNLSHLNFKTKYSKMGFATGKVSSCEFSAITETA